MQKLKCRLSMFALLAATIMGCSDPEEPREIYLVYDVLPGPGVPLVRGEVDTSNSLYEDEYEVARDISTDVAWDAFRKLRYHFDIVEHKISPGGDYLNTSPSMYTIAQVVGDDTEISLIGNALGYALFQSSILIIDFESTNRTTGYVTVRFKPGELDATLAQRFFVHVASIHEGLAVQYFSMGDELLFVNLRLPDGTPYSRLGDHDFANVIQEAAETFPDAEVIRWHDWHAYTELVENDWETFPDGRTYLQAVTSAGLDEDDFRHMQLRYNTLILDAADRYGWQPEPPPAAASEHGAASPMYQPGWNRQLLRTSADRP